MLDNNEVKQTEITSFNTGQSLSPQLGDYIFQFISSSNSYINLNLGEIGGGLSFGGYFYWEQYSNMNKVQMFNFGDSNGDNEIQIYYDFSIKKFIVIYEVEGGNTNTYTFVQSITYDIYVHYLFIFDTDGKCSFYKNFKEVSGTASNGNSQAPVVTATREYSYVGKPANSNVQYFGGRVEFIIAFNGEISSNQMECFKKNNVCDESQDYVKKYNCKSCDNKSQSCSSCDNSSNFILSETGQCECDFGFESSGKSCVAKENIIPGVSQETMEAAGNTSKAVISSMIVTNPTMAITLIDTLQMIKYTIYLDYEFPNIVNVYFELFSGMADFDFLPSLSASNANFMDPPAGFVKFDEDAYLFGNINSYIWLTFLCGLGWYAMRKIHTKIDYNNRKNAQVKVLYRKVLQKFEYDVYFMGIVQSFLFTNICCLMTLKSLAVDNIWKAFAYITALIIICVQFATIYAIYKLAKVYKLNTLVHGDPDIDVQDMDEMQKQMKDIKRGQGLLNPDLDYDEEDEVELGLQYKKEQYSKQNSQNSQNIDVITEEDEENDENNSEKNEETKKSGKQQKFSGAGATANEQVKLGISGQAKKGGKISRKVSSPQSSSSEKELNSGKHRNENKNENSEESEEKQQKLSLLELTFYQRNLAFENPYLFYQFFKQTNFLFEDVKHDSLWQLNFQAIYCIRKFIYGFALVYLNENVTCAACIWICLNIFMIWYFIKYKPQEFKRSYWNEMLQEFWFMIIYISVIMLTLIDPENMTYRLNLSYMLIGFATLILVQDMLMSFYDTGYSIYEATCLRLRHAKNEQVMKRQKKMKEKYIFNELDQMERANRQSRS